MFNNLVKLPAVLAEYLGTAIVAMIFIILSQTTGVSYFIGTSVAITLAVAYMMFAKISQAHLNPAITFGMWTVRRINTVSGIVYIAAQLLGGLTSWKLYEYFTGHQIAMHTTSWDWHIVFAEAVGTLILAMGFGAAVSKGLTAMESALTYGFSFFVGIMVAATASAAYLNPAIALSLRSFDWGYILG